MKIQAFVRNKEN